MTPIERRKGDRAASKNASSSSRRINHPTLEIPPCPTVPMPFGKPTRHQPNPASDGFASASGL